MGVWRYLLILLLYISRLQIYLQDRCSRCSIQFQCVSDYRYKQTIFLNFIRICLFISLFSSYFLSLTYVYMLGFILNKKNRLIYCKSTIKYGNCSLT
jgi:hypothetical protein